MKVLLLGGTRFLGKALAAEGLKRGHEITLFNRGTNKDAFSEVEQLIGNRDSDVSMLENRKWDVVMDTCGFAPHQIKKIAAVSRVISNIILISQASLFIKIGLLLI
ncbi:nucleoside-diphosphate-sugar epimerase [Cytobacillus purgationiresistens]|uniref:Nucleoside-diphosphate-sugar epimerase n=1 Tax=Cytobacillus purgationiresistens TaxID=863449 RepID=A0ABU0ANF9_9BACI|nr:nucleoside-diphosphate-sugar epimerase [Cytobacillus purgationiresistens]